MRLYRQCSCSSRWWSAGDGARIAAVLKGPDSLPPLEYETPPRPPAPQNVERSVALALLIVAGVHLIWGLLYIYHSRVNPAFPKELWWMLAGGAIPFAVLAGIARVAPRTAAVAGLLTLVAVHFGIALYFRDPATLYRGPLFKVLALVILLRTMVMALGAPPVKQRG
jgi:uncharacterized membrane protein